MSPVAIPLQIEIPMQPKDALVLGVVSDTHVPDRGLKLHRALVRSLAAAGVSAILHAGDIATPSVLVDLGEIAPVIAVQGNRDWLLRKTLPTAVRLTVGPVTIGLAHGHGGLRRYLIDKAQNLASGYQADRYRRLLRILFPQAQGIVYGHTHRVDNTWVDGCLYFNPGATGGLAVSTRGPSFGLLKIGPGEALQGEVIYLNEVRNLNR